MNPLASPPKVNPFAKLPRVAVLKDSGDCLYYHDVKTKKELLALMAFMLSTLTVNPSITESKSAIFKANDELYLLLVDADGNPQGDYFIELDLHKCICDNTSDLITWFDLYAPEEDERYSFDDVWKELDDNPPVLKCPRSSFAESFTGSFSPEGINAGINQYVTMLSQVEVFANLFAQLKD